MEGNVFLRAQAIFRGSTGRSARRKLLFLAAGVALAIACIALIRFSPTFGARRPNVLIVTIDTLRADHLGCYGYRAARTPHIDQLATEGVLCTDAIAAAPITMPSHSSILTGLLPPAHGVRDNGAYALGDDNVTLAERLKARGYSTQAFVSAIVLARRYNLTQGFDGYDDDLWAEDSPKLFMIRDRPAARTADRAIAWLERWAGTPERKPFFLWVHFFDPHQPYEASAEDAAGAATPYDAEITSADRGVGRLLEALRARGVLDDTLVVLTADHGESLGEHGEKTHALFVYDATVRVPLVLRYPRLLPKGTVYPGSVRSVDIVPTVLAALRLPGGRETQGRDLLDPLRGRSAPLDLPQYAESLLSELGFGMAPLYSVRQGGFKFIRAPRPELYDLRNDPRELHNLYATDRGRAGRLERELDRLLQESARQAHAARENPMSRESEEALRALGYVAPATDRQSMGGMDPKDGIAIYRQLEDARHLAQGRRWQQAETVLRGILAEIPGHLSARNILALCLVRQNKLDEARKEYERSLAQDPGQARVLAMLGTLDLLNGDDAAAERQYRDALARMPGFVEAMVNLGFIQSLRDDNAGAEAWYAKAVAADPGLPVVHRRIGDLHYERRDYAGALASYRRALEVAPHDFQALVQAGNAAKHVGEDETARGYFDRASTVRPDSWLPAYNKACLEATRGRTADALASLDVAIGKGFRALQLLKHDPELATLRGQAEFRARLAAVERAARAAPAVDDAES
jgi:arylsulfatase A-like enzyme/Tfp pilus assembly protein PilF